MEFNINPYHIMTPAMKIMQCRQSIFYVLQVLWIRENIKQLYMIIIIIN